MFRIATYFLLVLSALTFPVRAAEGPTAVVETLHAALVQSMKGGTKLGFAGRKALLDPVVRATYDLPAMARVATGSTWTKMSEAERSQVTEAFADWTVATYASQFKAFDGESFKTKGETEGPRGRRAVETSLIAKGEEPVGLNYQLREDDGRWKIIDVYLDGSVSQLAIRRNEFAGVLGKGGVAGLIESMKALSAQLAKGG